MMGSNLGFCSFQFSGLYLNRLYDLNKYLIERSNYK